MPTLHPYIKKRRQEDKKFEEIVLPALKRLSEAFYNIKEDFDQWKEIRVSTSIVASDDLPFKEWKPAKHWIGIGISGKDAYDYSGEVVGIYPDKQEIVLASRLGDIYSGETRESSIPHSGLFYLTYFESLMNVVDSGKLANDCPFPYYLDAENSEEKGFDKYYHNKIYYVIAVPHIFFGRKYKNSRLYYCFYVSNDKRWWKKEK